MLSHFSPTALEASAAPVNTIPWDRKVYYESYDRINIILLFYYFYNTLGMPRRY